MTIPTRIEIRTPDLTYGAVIIDATHIFNLKAQGIQKIKALNSLKVA